MSRPVAIAAGTGDQQGVNPHLALKLLGFSVAETAGTAAAAEVIIRHGESSSDPQLVAPINLDPNGFGIRPVGGEKGVECPKGIFIDRVSGNTSLVLYIEGG